MAKLPSPPYCRTRTPTDLREDRREVLDAVPSLVGIEHRDETGACEYLVVVALDAVGPHDDRRNGEERVENAVLALDNLGARDGAPSPRVCDRPRASRENERDKARQ